MMKTLLKFVLVILLAVNLTGFGPCAQIASSKLDRDNPVTIDCWHYYNGEQQANFDRLVETFNRRVGAGQGIVVRAESKGNVADLTAAVRVAAKSGTQMLPDIFAAYPGTAFELATEGRLLDLTLFLDPDDLDQFNPSFLDEGRFVDGKALYILPLAKSSEAIAVNMTFWSDFAAANPRFADTAATLSTWELLAQAAEAYRHWSKGEALFGFDSLANFLLVGSRQLGTNLMGIEKGKGHLDLNRETLRRLWDLYYVNIVTGSFAQYDSYRTEDLAQGRLVAAAVSTASGSWLPAQAIKDGRPEPIELQVYQYPTFRDAERVCVQQGAGMAIVRSNPPDETAAAIFLGWLTRPEQNVLFTISSGYLPVTDKALESQLMRDSLENLDRSRADQAGIALCLETFLTQLEDSRLFYPAAFKNSDSIRNYLAQSLSSTAADARQKYLADVAANSLNTDPQKLLERYVNDVAFESWYSAIILETERLLNS
ncbi:MAG: extracellular solute-binding protein [Saccharofermentanales bacterium]|nr:extracellular solute-binding protein [Clostridiaceae bacterium]